MPSQTSFATLRTSWKNPPNEDDSFGKQGMEKSRQHWVPSSYLKAWCDPESKCNPTPYLWRFKRNGGGGRRKAPHNIFAETDFYTMHLPDGTRDLALENGLKTLEDKFSHIRAARIEKRQLLSSTEKQWFCAFVIAMHFRTKAQRNAFRQQWGHVVKVAENLQDALAAMTPAERARYRKPKMLGDTRGPSLSIADARTLTEKPIQSMLPTIMAEDVPVLAQMNLSIFTTEDDLGFITSDHPCVWFDPQRRRQLPSLQSRTIEVSMPVSPHSLAFFCWDDFPAYSSVSLGAVDDANRFRHMACDEYFVARRNTTKQVWFT
jgi:hypothetical protein